MLDIAVEPTKLFRQALGTFATGVTVVTAIDEQGRPRGFTANSFTSVSLDPPLILVCIASGSAGHAVFTNSNTFCVNVLAEDQQNLSTLFASPGDDRFSEIEWHPGNNGNPIIDGAITNFECDRHNIVDAGDHVILVGKVSSYEASGRSPLIYCSGSYVEFSLMQKAMEVPGSGITTRISALINCDGQVPMHRARTTGKLSLPAAEKHGNANEPKSLAGKLASFVNVLAEDQQNLSTLFASPGDDRFSEIEWHPGNNGNPIIDGAITNFECDRHNIVDAGDHVILVGKVSSYEASGRSPLIYCSGSYVEFSLMQKAMEVPGSGITTRISALINCDGQVPMHRARTTGKLNST